VSCGGPGAIRCLGLALSIYLTVAGWANAAVLGFDCDSGDGRQLRSVPCEVTLVPRRYTLPPIVIPPGQAIAVPPGAYDIRAGAPGLALVTNATVTVTPDGPPGHGAEIHLSPGGTVVLGGTLLPRHGAVELLSLSTGRVDTVFVDREHTLPFPAGKLVALGLARPGVVEGLSEPMTLGIGRQELIDRFEPARPGRGHALVAVAYGGSLELQDGVISLERNGQPVSSSIQTNKSPYRGYAAFYNLEAGEYAVHVISRYWNVPPTAVRVAASAATLVDAIPLRLKPKIAVSLNVDPSLAGAPREVSLYACPQADEGSTITPDIAKCRRIRSETTPTNVADLPFLDPGRYFVQFVAGGHRTGRWVEVGSEDIRTSLSIRPVRLHGEVTRAGRGISAALEFTNDDFLDAPEKISTESDEGGHYQAIVWSLSYLAHITPKDGEPGDSVEKAFFVPRGTEPEQDFKVPGEAAVVTVVDASSGQPIGSASVNCMGRRRQTDAEGRARFGALPPRRLECTATAEDHLDGTRTFDLTESDSDQVFSMELQRRSAENSFRALFPTGQAAAGTDAYIGFGTDAVNGFGGPHTVCDQTGLCSLGDRPPDSTPIYLVNAAAGLTVVAAGKALDDGTVVLQSAAPPFAVTLDTGTQPANERVMGMVFVDGVEVPNGLLRQLGAEFGAGPDVITVGRQEPVLRFGGLPAGVILLRIVTVNGASVGSVLAPPTEVPLPAPSAVHIELP
jgi:hypothetical protein